MRITGASLLAHYGHSVRNILTSIYPHHNWLPWRFKFVSRKFWNSKENIVTFLEWFRAQKHISLSGFYNVSINDILEAGGMSNYVFHLCTVCKELLVAT